MCISSFPSLFLHGKGNFHLCWFNNSISWQHNELDPAHFQNVGSSEVPVTHEHRTFHPVKFFSNRVLKKPKTLQAYTTGSSLLYHLRNCTFFHELLLPHWSVSVSLTSSSWEDSLFQAVFSIFYQIWECSFPQFTCVFLPTLKTYRQKTPQP